MSGIFRQILARTIQLPRSNFTFKNMPSYAVKQKKIKTTSVALSPPTSSLWRYFHTTHKKDALPPLVLLLIRPVAKLGAILFGRFIRKWWQKLPSHERDLILKKLKSKQFHLAFGGTIFFGGLLFYCIEHIHEDPITRRKRFILYNDSQMLTISQLEFENQIDEHKKQIIPINHPIYNRVSRVANKILQANKNLPQISSKKWAITVVDRPDISNAFVLPHGKIFLFTGMLNVCTNDDQLAVVLSHEIAHAVLSHMAENLSKVILVEYLLLIPLIIFWAVFSDAGALFSQYISSKVAEIMIHLPFSRAIEKEADEVGLQLAAQACFDIREAPVFWAKMSIVNDSPVPVEWLSTHPSNETRQMDLAALIPMALDIRCNNHCPKLPSPSFAQIVYSSPKL